MSGKNNNRQGGGKHPNSPRYSDRYGKGHINPYLGGQPKHDTLLREIEERQNAVRRENEQEARRLEAMRAAEEEKAAQPPAESAVETEGETPTAQPVRGTVRRKSREEIVQPKAMNDPKLRERLRQIQEQAMNEAKAFRENRQPDGADFDEDGSAPDVKLKLSEDNKPLIALESRGSDGKVEIRWIPVVLSEEEMEAFFPAIEPMQECREKELEDNNNELKLSEESGLLPDEDGLVLIPIAGVDEEPGGEENGSTAGNTVVELIDNARDGEKNGQSAVDELISALPVIEVDAQDADTAEDADGSEDSEQPPADSEPVVESSEAEETQPADESAEQPSEAEDAAEDTTEDESGKEDFPEDEQQEQSDGQAEPSAEETAQPEEAAQESADEKPDGENNEDDKKEENAEPQPEEQPEKTERPRRKRRRPQQNAGVTEEQAGTGPEEAAPEESAEQEDAPARSRRTAVASRPVYDDLNASKRYAQSRYSEDEGEQDDSLFIRRKRSRSTALFALPDGGKLPNYIDDDDFVERWLGEGEEEDMASESKRRRRRISTLIGAVTMVLALIGFIAIARWGIGLLSGIGNTDSQKSEYADFISPVVMSEVPVFEAWDAIPQDKLLQSAIFSVLLEMNVSYERDDTGKFIIPSTDIVNAVKELYGAYSDDPAQDEEINTRIRNALYGSAGEDTNNTDVYYVDMEDSFHVADGLSGPAPQVTDISRRDNTVTLTVQYLEDLEGGSGGLLYSRQYILTLEGEDYYVQAIREYDE